MLLLKVIKYSHVKSGGVGITGNATLLLLNLSVHQATNES